MTEGYIYCFSNESMPGILKVGMTERTPEARLGEANASDTWRPPTPYKIECAKKVSGASEKEKTLHTLLEQYTDRIHPRREFFRVSKEEVRKFLDLMDGEMWTETQVDDNEYDDKESSESVLGTNSSKMRGCRDMNKCFTNGQRIRHVIGITKNWTGIYDSLKKGIVYDGVTYTSLSAFSRQHYRIDRTDRCCESNGWKECECELDGKWVSTYALPG
jgi:hypothetical protein